MEPTSTKTTDYKPPLKKEPIVGEDEIRIEVIKINYNLAREEETHIDKKIPW